MKNKKREVVRYRGIEIKRDIDEQGRKWYVDMQHAGTGLYYSPSDCQHYYTIRDAKNSIDRDI